MAFDDVTLFEMHFDGATFGVPARGEAVDDVVVTDPDRMVEDDAVEAAESSPSRGRRAIAAVAVVAAAVAARAVYRRRTGGEEAAAVAVESVDEYDDVEAEPVEQ